MSSFQQYLVNLPRPSPEDRGLLHPMQPYIIQDIVYPRQQAVCPECTKTIPTRSLAVYVPSQREAVEFNFHPTDSGDKICSLEEPQTDDHYKTLESIAAQIKIEALMKLALKGFARLPPVYP